MSKTDDLRDLFTDVTGQNTVTEEQHNDTRRVDAEDADDVDTQALPTTDAECPECGHDTAYFYLQQTRSADESETRFFICTECDQKWRGYD